MGNALKSVTTKTVTPNNASLEQPATAEPSFSTGDLGQLQEILFGQQQRTTHQQIQELQSNMQAEIQSLRSMMTETIASSDKENKEANKQLQAALETSEKSVKAEIKQSQASLLAEVKTSLDALQNDKVNNEQLASLLTDMAGYLSKK